ncbi:hypothetical protein [Nonomuraea turcica]|uniref:hypothetical protein n=1 Tax=Nonomuraea sp. G32 TaxID=3067274 RepID=UPI00273C30F7|nr:hypothetical protein [Nonomuraea sp. G32]MDP4506919.1 hypothetical protein [Nonomuraea sp. G32]
MLLLYAQLVSRLVRLTLADVIRDGEQVLIRIGTPPSPVPDPFATVLLDYVASRPNMCTATNHRRDRNHLQPPRPRQPHIVTTTQASPPN